MQKLTIEIDYTVDDPTNFEWLVKEIPETLRKLDLDAEVLVASNSFSLNDNEVDDGELFQLTRPLIEDSAARMNAENHQGWYVHVLVTKRHSMEYLGVMYDFGFDSLARQGCAVFWEEVLKLAKNRVRDFQKVMLRTVLHEIGHCLNLGHQTDGTLMTQTNLLIRSNWIQNIKFDFAPDDVQRVADFPSLSQPGGENADFGTLEDKSYKSSSRLIVSIRPFQDSGSRVFHIGAPVSLLLKLRNKGKQPVNLLQPLSQASGNIKVWLKAPGKGVRLLQSAIRGCGYFPKKFPIKAGECFVPLYLFADHNGYLFNEEGTYKIRVAMKSADGQLFHSRFFTLQLKAPSCESETVKRLINHPDILRFMLLENTQSHSGKAKVNQLLKIAPQSETSRAIYWALLYEWKKALRKGEASISDKSLFKKVIPLYEKLIRAETSTIRKGKILKELYTHKASMRRPAQEIPAEHMEAIEEYNRFEKKLIKQNKTKLST